MFWINHFYGEGLFEKSVALDCKPFRYLWTGNISCVSLGRKNLEKIELMPLRQILGRVSKEHYDYPIGKLIKQLGSGIRDTLEISELTVWLAEEENGHGEYFFYAVDGLHNKVNSARFPTFSAIVGDTSKFSELLTKVTGRTQSKFVPVFGLRFGQRSDGQYLMPVYKLVGCFEVDVNADADRLSVVAELFSTVLWNHRSSRFLVVENEVDSILLDARTRQGERDWRLVAPIVLRSTHSSRFAIVARKSGILSDRLGLAETELGEEFYLQKIGKSEEALENGAWLRSMTPMPLTGERVAFWMIVPLKTPHYRHGKKSLEVTDRTQHYAILETEIPSSDSSRFVYSSADRRLVEHSLIKFLQGIAEYRIDEVTREISDLIPDSLPEDAIEETQAVLKFICDRVYDVCDACIVTPAIALERMRLGHESSSMDAAVFAFEEFEIPRHVLDQLMQFDSFDGTYLNSKHVEAIEMGEHSGLVFSLGGSIHQRFIVFLFKSPYSSYVTAEICSRVSARLHLFLQACDLMNERTASLTQMAHVLRGPVSSALEEIRGIIRDRRNPPRHIIKFEGALTEDEKLVEISNRLSRSRSLTDSAKYLLGQLGPQSFQRRRIDFFAVYGEVRSAVELLRKQKSISINLKDDVSGTGDEKAFVFGDADLLWLMLYNLMENAVKYARRESEINVVVRNSGEDELIVEITNFGDLIWEYDEVRIFEPYQRALNSLPMNGREGTGIGLPAANQIAVAFNPNRTEGIKLTQSARRTDNNTAGKITFSTRLTKA